jgi:hypothetical protein
VAIPGASGVFLLSGGKILYRIRGPVRSAANAGTLAALNHSIQGPGTFTPSSPASFIHSRFCAAAVRKRALELPAACSQGDNSQVEGFHTASVYKRKDKTVRARVSTPRSPTSSVHGRFCVSAVKERAPAACSRNYCQGKNCDVIQADVRGIPTSEDRATRVLVRRRTGDSAQPGGSAQQG